MRYRLWMTVMFLFALQSHSSFAQYNIPENNVWIRDPQFGLDFNTTPPHSLFLQALPDQLNAANVSVSSATGKLLFYTDGSFIWDSSGQKMLGANPLGADSLMGMVTYGYDGALITAVPGNPGKYYVFSLTDNWNYYPGPGLLYYSEVDMQLNGGQGSVVPDKRWVPLDTGLTDELIAVQGDNCNIWLVTHSKDTNMFKAYEITWNGINPTPVISYTGATSQWAVAQITISPDRKTLAASYGSSVELYDFDPSTGIVSNGWAIDSVDDEFWGVCFSPDNSKLYVTRNLAYPTATWFDLAIDQFDLSQPTHAAIKYSQTNVAGVQFNGYGAAGEQLRLGPDNKIYYVSYYDYNVPTDSYGIIEYPNALGTACQANQNFIPGFAGSDWMGVDFVKAISHPYPDTTMLAGLDTCMLFNSGDSLTLHAPQGDFLFYTWNNGSTDTTLPATKPGIYWVTSIDRCLDKTIDTFTIKTLPVFSLGDDTTVCSVPLLLKVDNTDWSYLWSTGSTASSIQVPSSGAYWAQATSNGCSYADTIQVAALDLHQSLGNDTSFCREDAFQLSLNANAPAGADILWSTGSISPSINVTDSGTYWVAVTDMQCAGSDTMHIAAEKCNCHFGMPTAFTPNSDGKNDAFRMVIEPDCPIGSYLINIYNRWGQLVYTGTSPEAGWDGTFNGQAQDIGTYMFTIDFTVGTLNNHYYQKGDVTLIR